MEEVGDISIYKLSSGIDIEYNVEIFNFYVNNRKVYGEKGRKGRKEGGKEKKRKRGKKKGEREKEEGRGKRKKEKKKRKKK